MKLSRRELGKSVSLLLGANLLEFLAKPVSGWTRTPVVPGTAIKATGDSLPVTFVDVAQKAGLTVPNVWGGVKKKKYILETKGSGVAFFDYDNDGWLDIYLTNGVRLEETYAPGKAPTSHLYKNNRDGTFTDVTERSGLGANRMADGSLCW